MTTKTVCIDARMANASGIGTYLQGLLRGLAQQPSPDRAYRLITTSADDSNWPWPSERISAGIYSIREQLQVPQAFRYMSSDLLHSPHYNAPAWLIRRSVITVHDLIHLKFPEFFPSPAARLYAHFYFHHLVPKARALLTVSEHTKSDLINLLGIPEDRITVTYPGVPEGFRVMASEDYAPVLRQLQLPKDYFLFVGNLKKFKNVEFLLKGYQQLRQNSKDIPALVLVGRNFIPGFDHRLQQSPGVTWLGEVSRSQLPSVYAGAVALVFPSLYEGFGLPPLEAMACGTPVLCSDRASLPEVVGDAAIRINPEDLEDYVEALRRLSQDSTLRRQLSEKGVRRAAQFSWDSLVSKTKQVYEKCLS